MVWGVALRTTSLRGVRAFSSGSRLCRLAGPQYFCQNRDLAGYQGFVKCLAGPQYFCQNRDLARHQGFVQCLAGPPYFCHDGDLYGSFRK